MSNHCAVHLKANKKIFLKDLSAPRSPGWPLHLGPLMSLLFLCFEPALDTGAGTLHTVRPRLPRQLPLLGGVFRKEPGAMERRNTIGGAGRVVGDAPSCPPSTGCTVSSELLAMSGPITLQLCEARPRGHSVHPLNSEDDSTCFLRFPEP